MSICFSIECEQCRKRIPVHIESHYDPDGVAGFCKEHAPETDIVIYYWGKTKIKCVAFRFLLPLEKYPDFYYGYCPNIAGDRIVKIKGEPYQPKYKKVKSKQWW